MSHSDKFDVIVIGAGHNGLAAAATLAKRGKKVCVLERTNAIGGMAQSRDNDGTSVPYIAHLLHNLNPTVVKELGLSSAIKLKELPTIALDPDGRHIEIAGNKAQYTDGSAHPDAAIYEEIRARIIKFGQLLEPMAARTAPDLSEGASFAGLPELMPLAKLGLKMKLMGKKEMREFMRIALSNVYDLILDDMEDGVLAGSLAADSVWGMWTGPRSPGTVLSLMYRYCTGGQSSLPIGGMGAISHAIADVAKNNGAQIRTNSAAEKLVVEDDQVTGVVLKDGTTIETKAVMSSAGAFQSMMIGGHENFDVEAVRRLRNVRSKGTTAKVNIVLKDVPEIAGLSDSQMASRLLIAPSAYYIEQAFNAIKYGEMPPAPVIEAVIPSLSDTSIAASGKHVLSAVVQYIPYYLEGGWNDKARNKLTKIVVDTLSKYAPDLRDKIDYTETLSPADIEQETGAPGGHWHHCEFSTDQMLAVRPVNLLARYAFGIKGFYLCGASAHPGGDVSGLAGRNSALQLIKDGAAS